MCPSRRMKGMRGMVIALAAAAWLSGGASVAMANAGSWVADAQGLRVAVPGRDTSSRTLSPPRQVTAGTTITRVAWRYRMPPGRSLSVSLCHPSRCIPLSSSSGTSSALAGLPANASLHFRFRLPEGPAVQVEGLQVIVDYR